VALVFASLDDDVGTILNRMAAIEAFKAFEPEPGETGEQYRRARAAAIQINHLRRRIDDPRTRAAKDAAVSRITELVESGRLQLGDISNIQTHQDVESMIRRAASNGMSPLVVVDAVFNLSVGAEDLPTREANIQRANYVKALATRFDVPVLATAEIRKAPPGRERSADNPPRLDDIMESGKFAYNADCVAMLYPRDPDTFQGNETAELVFDIQKNKWAGYKGRLILDFRKLAGVIEPAASMEARNERPARSAATVY